MSPPIAPAGADQQSDIDLVLDHQDARRGDEAAAGGFARLVVERSAPGGTRDRQRTLFTTFAFLSRNLSIYVYNLKHRRKSSPLYFERRSTAARLALAADRGLTRGGGYFAPPVGV
jgi:hypothetical protein